MAAKPGTICFDQEMMSTMLEDLDNSFIVYQGDNHLGPPFYSVTRIDTITTNELQSGQIVSCHMRVFFSNGSVTTGSYIAYPSPQGGEHYILGSFLTPANRMVRP
jgi:hypothetical protein